MQEKWWVCSDSPNTDLTCAALRIAFESQYEALRYSCFSLGLKVIKEVYLKQRVENKTPQLVISK
ncbi:hypothetical protein [Shewanella polaris]|uniref:Uncharacterized protein n=1 Tax=Shewanella polaris TaxID=2588449 RepID=A0A4Y5YIY5_9GAMM|nr:hypothetical protein [Shewanella polaris]QDE32423.1 hypothetical protein FH971_16505 [Shewanella polaris]